MKLAGRTAIITGGSKGIGLGCARVFGRHGAKVVIAARGEQAGTQAEAELRQAGTHATFMACDVADESQMQSLVERAVAHLGRLDCIVNNAGWHPPAMSIDQISVEDFERLLRLNLTSTFMGCKFALPHLLATHGSIINMSSAVALVGQSAAASYVATKGGQIGLTRALAVDLAPRGVRVNAVAPAGVMTPLVKEWADSEYDPAEAIESVHRWHLLGRMATIDEIGEICAFLASDEASFLTGQVICADGGAALGYAVKAERFLPGPFEQLGGHRP
jgi:NAD(P)-dependent dehydrogenase (short-subunit alcohol dehydrogenase family)